MSKIIFKINDPDQEKVYTESLKGSVDFFNSHRIVTTWPQKDVDKEYDTEAYMVFKSRIEEEWKQKENKFLNKIETLFNLKFDEPFEVYISNYGVGGCYNSPRKITINKQLPYNHVSNIKHEIIHLLIEPFIKEYNIDFNRKESIVEAILGVLESQD